MAGRDRPYATHSLHLIFSSANLPLPTVAKCLALAIGADCIDQNGLVRQPEILCHESAYAAIEFQQLVGISACISLTRYTF